MKKTWTTKGILKSFEKKELNLQKNVAISTENAKKEELGVFRYNLVFLFNIGPRFFLFSVGEICAVLAQQLSSN